MDMPIIPGAQLYWVSHNTAMQLPLRAEVLFLESFGIGRVSQTLPQLSRLGGKTQEPIGVIALTCLVLLESINVMKRKATHTHIVSESPAHCLDLCGCRHGILLLEVAHPPVQRLAGHSMRLRTTPEKKQRKLKQPLVEPHENPC